MPDDYLHDCVGGHPQCTTSLRASADCPHCLHRKMGSLDTIIRGSGFQHNRQREAAHDYKMGLGDPERKVVEESSFNYFQTHGKPLQVPPSLYADLQRYGVSMKYIEANDALETRGLTSQ